MEVKFNNHADNRLDVFSLRDGYWGVSADITLGSDGSGPVVAQINRNPWTTKDLLADKQTVGPLSTYFGQHGTIIGTANA